jgi:hypothetical protein
MMFMLGTHEASWLGNTNVPLFISVNRLARYAGQAGTPWALDSGGFTELSEHGYWRTDAKDYARRVARAGEKGMLQWAAPQDWMCEPFIVAKTGLTVREHQVRTVGNYLDLKALRADVIPVLQGFNLGDYLQCIDLYEQAGVDLSVAPLVGVGSVCRRENTAEIGTIFAAIIEAGVTRLHGFGCKEGAVRRYGKLMTSADSLAWSKGGKERGTCTHLKSRCANHKHWALEWRTKLLQAPQGSATQCSFGW